MIILKEKKHYGCGYQCSYTQLFSYSNILLMVCLSHIMLSDMHLGRPTIDQIASYVYNSC